MLILHVVTSLTGGVGKVVQELLEVQFKNGYKTALIYAYGNEEEIKKTIGKYTTEIFRSCILHIPGINIFIGIPYKKVYYYLMEKYKDKVIVHFHNPISIGIFSCLNQINCCCTIHGKYIEKRIGKILYNIVLHKKIFFIGVSEDTTNFCKKVNKNINIETIYNGIHEINLKHERMVNNLFKIGFVGFLTDHKGWKYIIYAMKKMKTNLEKYDIELVGKFNNTGHIFENLNLKEKEKERIHYIGQVEDAGRKIIPELDVLVLPSLSEGLPICIIEALRAGVPVLATNVGGIPEILKDGENGYFIERNAKSIAEKLDFLIANLDVYQKLSNTAIEIYKSNFSSEIMHKGYERIYFKLMMNK